jgi:hypothetical protein
MGDDVRSYGAASPEVRYMVCENDHLWPEWVAKRPCFSCQSNLWRPPGEAASPAGERTKSTPQNDPRKDGIEK